MPMKYSRIQFLTCFATVSTANAQNSKPERTAVLRVRVTSRMGTVANSGRVRLYDPTTGLQVAIVELTPSGTHSNKSSEGDEKNEFVFEGIPFGSYRVEVTVPLLRQSKRELFITVDKVAMWRTITLDWNGPIRGFDGEPSRYKQVAGRITVLGRIATLPTYWVKLIGIYEDVFFESTSNERGEFTFEQVPRGVYVLVITTPSIAEPVLRQLRIDDNLVFEIQVARDQKP